MSMPDPQLLAELALADEQYQRCLGVDTLEGEGRGLWYLMTQFLPEYSVGAGLGSQGLSETFHRPMLRAWDVIDTRRVAGEQIDTLDLWPRDHYKTWCMRARVIREIMRNPALTVQWWHAVEAMAEESVVAIGKQLQGNKQLRRLCKGSPLSLPAVGAKRFVSASGFSLPANRVGEAPSMRSAGVGTEVTGAHSELGVLDDPIGLNDVLDNQMPKKRTWYSGTARNVVRSTGCFNTIGTRWAVDDLYAPWLASPLWTSVVRACLETGGVPDYNGQPVFLTMEQISRKRAEIGEMMFALQMMNDANPPSELPWKLAPSARATLFVPWREEGEQFGAEGPGSTFVLSDPAPAVVGSQSGRGEKKRADGTKDEWAVATIKFRNLNGLRVAILLELTASRDWTINQGFDECCRQMSRWGTNKLVPEFGNLDWTPAARAAAQRNGVPLYIDEKGRVPRFLSNYAHGAKNVRFATLASWAQSNQFYICEKTVDAGMLDRLFGQCEHWRPLPNGENTLPHDDLADVVARCTDPLFARWTPPLVERREADKDAWRAPYRTNQEEDVVNFRGRHIRW